MGAIAHLRDSFTRGDTAMKSNSVEEVLNGYAAYVSGYDLAPELSLEEADQALDAHYLAIFLELIGEDEKSKTGGYLPRYKRGMNDLRKELRTAARERFK